MTIYHVALEPIEQRYTAQWYTAIPEEIKKHRPNIEVVTIDGGVQTGTTAGAFLDFAITNVWKNNQINTIAQMFSRGEIKPNDVFLFTDSWNTGIIQVRYMSELLGIPVTIHGIWHAGSYDKTDILGFTIQDKRWSHTFERSVYHALDYNWFGSKYHRDLFCNILNVSGDKAYHSGQPHLNIINNSDSIPLEHKENIILFGHRISPDKQPEIFEDLSTEFPDYDFVFSQKLNLSKSEYYELIRKAKISFSANKHENFGISMVEAVFNKTVPLMPTRLSYNEMYLDSYLYPTEWTQDWHAYQTHKQDLVNHIKNILYNYDAYYADLQKQQEFLMENYMTSKNMISLL